MSFENLDTKIKDAADQHHPAYDENAWRKMEKLLNEHLPQSKEDKRRIVFFFLLFLLLGGGSLLFITKPWNRNKEIAKQFGSIHSDSKQSSNIQPDNSSQNVPGEQYQNNSENKDQSQSNKPVDQTENNVISTDQNLNTREQVSLVPDKNSVSKPSAAVKQKNDQKNEVVSSLNPNQDETKTNVSASVVNNTNSNVKQDQTTGDLKNIVTGKKEENNTVKNNIAENKIVQTDKDRVTKTETKKNTKTSQPKNGFAFTVSAGPDVSKAGGSQLGKTTFLYGAGISYTKSSFTLRSGIYGAKKIYKANANDYKLSYALPSGTVFENAQADCSVIVVPVNFYYNFGLRKNSNWFAGTGLSSYFMKREKYDYYYKSSSGVPYSYNREIKNKNNHYFSVLDLSAGYTKQISRSVSISAEPYINIPLQGIGEGKVHLKSGGVLFTIGVNPFNSTSKNSVRRGGKK